MGNCMSSSVNVGSTNHRAARIFNASGVIVKAGQKQQPPHIFLHTCSCCIIQQKQMTNGLQACEGWAIWFVYSCTRYTCTCLIKIDKRELVPWRNPIGCIVGSSPKMEKLGQRGKSKDTSQDFFHPRKLPDKKQCQGNTSGHYVAHHL